MHSWRDHILKEFAPEVSRLTLVADPDGLLLEEGILEGIRERGFELIPFEDHIAFRYAYESKFRTRWDRGEHTDLVVVLRSQASDLAGLPFDLLQAGRKLSFNLGDIFPSLSYPVVTLLERADLDALYEAQRRYAPGPLGDNATKEFALRHVFEIAPELIKQPSDLLRVLIRRHYLAQRVPAVLDERLIQLLGSTQQFREWPLEVLVTDREAFFTFLQERWTIFLDQESNSDTTIVREDAEHYGLTVSGPVDLPFGHHDIRIYIDNLFAEGLLQPISHGHAAELSKTWMGIGVQTTPIEDVSRRLDKLIANLQLAIPTADARHTEWLHFARGWAELILLKCKQSDGIEDALSERIRSLREQVDVSFSVWLAKRYAGLVNLLPVPPVMLHHLPRFLARELSEQRKSKIALLVMDGLAYDQWLLVRDVLSAKHPTLCFREQAVFAWVPSITSVSRQATFAGKPPAFFPNSIQTTDKEPTLWSQFWADQGYSPSEVFYIKGLGDGTLDHVSEALSHPKVRIAGMVVDKVDKIMHGMELGTAGMHNQVAQWASLPYLSALIDLLLENGFRVYLTSDHGNVEAEGCGRPAEGALADLRGERVRVFPNEALRAQVLSQFPGATAWFPIGLPDNYLPLIAPARAAFIQEKRTTVSHGGFSIEELVVPLVQIEERTQ